MQNRLILQAFLLFLSTSIFNLQGIPLNLSFSLRQLKEIMQIQNDEGFLDLFKSAFIDANLEKIEKNARILSFGTKRGDPKYEMAQPLWNFVGKAKKIAKHVDFESIEGGFDLLEMVQFCRAVCDNIIGKTEEVLNRSDVEMVEISILQLGTDIFKITSDDALVELTQPVVGQKRTRAQALSGTAPHCPPPSVDDNDDSQATQVLARTASFCLASASQLSTRAPSVGSTVSLSSSSRTSTSTSSGSKRRSTAEKMRRAALIQGAKQSSKITSFFHPGS